MSGNYAERVRIKKLITELQTRQRSRSITTLVRGLIAKAIVENVAAEAALAAEDKATAASKQAQ